MIVDFLWCWKIFVPNWKLFWSQGGVFGGMVELSKGAHLESISNPVY